MNDPTILAVITFTNTIVKPLEKQGKIAQTITQKIKTNICKIPQNPTIKFLSIKIVFRIIPKYQSIGTPSMINKTSTKIHKGKPTSVANTKTKMAFINILRNQNSQTRLLTIFSPFKRIIRQRTSAILPPYILQVN